jgi:hypothetical protein
MDWYSSAAFVNWLNVSKGFQPAYNLNWSGSTWNMALWTATDAGYDANNLYRNSLAKYFLPSENEFYKAAFGLSDGSGYTLYATASNTPPIGVSSGTSPGTIVVNKDWNDGPASVFEAGGLSSYGTMGQTGNTFQWIEDAYDGINDSADKNRQTASIGYWYDISQPGYWYGGPEIVASTYTWDTAPSNVVYPYMTFRVASVPEPSTYALFGIGAILMLILMRRKKTA